MKYIFLLLISFSLGMMSCKNDQPMEKAEDQLLHDKVMAIHDEVMPKMSDIHRLKKELRAEIDSTQQEELESITRQLVLLNDADESMMDWMHELKIPEERTAKIEYLEGQVPLIENVRDKMLAAIETSEELLEDLKQ